jgi:hypothetical protein
VYQAMCVSPSFKKRKDIAIPLADELLEAHKAYLPQKTVFMFLNISTDERGSPIDLLAMQYGDFFFLFVVHVIQTSDYPQLRREAGVSSSLELNPFPHSDSRYCWKN